MAASGLTPAPARGWKAGAKKDCNFALCRFVVIGVLRIAPEIALLLCTASVSQYSFQARFDWAWSQTGLSLKQANQTMTIRNKGNYAALETV